MQGVSCTLPRPITVMYSRPSTRALPNNTTTAITASSSHTRTPHRPRTRPPPRLPTRSSLGERVLLPHPTLRPRITTSSSRRLAPRHREVTTEASLRSKRPLLWLVSPVSPSRTTVSLSEMHSPVRSSSFFHVGPYSSAALSSPASTRSYTPIKVLGDGSFGTVLLCDWHTTLPPNTPLSPMQCGQGARPEWAGKRLVAVKRMKKRWEGGWEECSRLKELEVRRVV